MSFWYLATPYSKYPGGIDRAFEAACKEAAFLIRNHVPVYCPIAHTHPIAMVGEINPYDHDIWLPADKPFMDAAYGLIVCQLETWDLSYGIAEEIKVFTAAKKPVIYMTPGVVPDIPLESK